MTKTKESKYAYVRQQADGWYRVTNNGEVVVAGIAWTTAIDIANTFGKKVRFQYDW